MDMLLDAEDGRDEICVSVPRGSPIYIADMVSPLTKVPDFEAAVLHELQDLKTELCCDSDEVYNDEIQVEELKIITEEELVNKAFEEAFKDDGLDANHSRISGKCSSSRLVNSRKQDNSKIFATEQASVERSGEGMNASVSQTSVEISSRVCNDTELRRQVLERRKKAKKGHIKKRNTDLEGGYISKVEELARIKQKQDEDKAAARLHSFNGSCPVIECPSKISKQSHVMMSLKSTKSSTKVRSSNAREYVQVQFPEVILCVEVYHNRRTSAKTQEFLVLGRQFLTEMRDKIYCLTDEIMKKAGLHDPSGYFLIEDVFCNDLRDSAAIDYSKPILDWLENSKSEALEKWECITSGEMQQKQKELLGSQTGGQLPRFRAVDMQKFRFCDLRFRLGAGYLYCHQGDCKHAIVIRDMRLIHPEDVQNRAAYPLITYQQKMRFQKCSVCKIYKAEKVTVDDKWAPENPCYFCDLCYYMLHYVNGSLLYNDFLVYDYFHE